MVATHPCIAPGCTARVNAVSLACRVHWYQLPKELRARVYETWHKEPGGPAHRAAIVEAQDVLRGASSGPR